MCQRNVLNALLPTTLQIFKWESRKGWDVLLEAFLSEFTAGDSVELYMLTAPYHSTADFKDRMQLWAKQRGLTGSRGDLFVTQCVVWA